VELAKDEELAAAAGRCPERKWATVYERELQALLDIYLLEKAVYELGYELNNRPEWITIPIQGIRDLLKTQAGRAGKKIT